MCLGVPGCVTAVDDTDALRMGTVSFAGVHKEVCLAYVPEAAVGDWVIVHAGFAIHQIAAAEAERTLALLDELESPT